jgi:hypothetical protein
MQTSQKPNKLPIHCPSCAQQLQVSALNCCSCGSVVQGHFGLPLLATLDSEEQQLIIDFVKSGGSIKDIAAQQRVSYPTMRNRIDALIARIAALEQERSTLSP